jgi:hypothetical protein
MLGAALGARGGSSPRGVMPVVWLGLGLGLGVMPVVWWISGGRGVCFALLWGGGTHRRAAFRAAAS